MTIINHRRAREYALQCSKIARNGRFTRVSKEFLLNLESAIRKTIALRVHAAPSKGKTL